VQVDVLFEDGINFLTQHVQRAVKMDLLRKEGYYIMAKSLYHIKKVIRAHPIERQRALFRHLYRI
jgi:hypothetical protein